MLYDRHGRRVQLSYVDELNLGRRGLSLDTEVAAIRYTWQRLRGPDWVEVPEIAALIAD